MESTFVTCVCRPLSLTYNPFRAYAGLVEPRIVYSNVKIDKIDWLDDAILTCRLERAEAEKLARMLEATEEWTI